MRGIGGMRHMGSSKINKFYWGVSIGILLGGLSCGISFVAAYQPSLLVEGLSIVRDKAMEEIAVATKEKLIGIPDEISKSSRNPKIVTPIPIPKYPKRTESSQNAPQNNSNSRSKPSKESNISGIGISNPVNTIYQYQTLVNRGDYQNAWNLLHPDFQRKKRLSYVAYKNWWSTREVYIERIISVKAVERATENTERTEKEKVEGTSTDRVVDGGVSVSIPNAPNISKTAEIVLIWNAGHYSRLYKSAVVLKYSDSERVWQIATIKTLS